MSLFEAVRKGDLEQIKAQVNSSNMHMVDEEGQTLLHVAAAREQAEIVSYLVGLGADVNVQSKDGQTALHYAAIRQNMPIAAMLIERGADLSIVDKHGNTPLWDAMSSSRKDYDLVDFLLSRGADPNVMNRAGRSVASAAIERNSQALLKVLAKHQV
jgi:ankyrin repeat protein